MRALFPKAKYHFKTRLLHIFSHLFLFNLLPEYRFTSKKYARYSFTYSASNEFSKRYNFTKNEPNDNKNKYNKTVFHI